jgi:hypothetical protein
MQEISNIQLAMMFFSWSASLEMRGEVLRCLGSDTFNHIWFSSGATCKDIHYKTHHVAGNRMKSIRWTVEVTCAQLIQPSMGQE